MDDEPSCSTETARTIREARTDRIDVVVIHGPDRGLAVHATRARCVIGTAADADLVLGDPTASRYHCEIVLEDRRAIVRDLGAKNRTVIDGVAVLAAIIEDGTVLTLGNTAVRFARQPEALQRELSARDQFGGLVGRSSAMRTVFALLEHAAASESVVLIHGEPGTGKGLAAASLHQESSRRDGPFIIVDAAAAPGDVLERELFGRAPGEVGALERAAGGTVCIDEIGALDPQLQRQLLRALEHRVVHRVGDTRSIPIDVRLIATSHRDLRADVNARRFRADLYFHLAGVEVRMPAVRERAEDIPDLVTVIASELELVPPSDPLWVAALMKHPWPGNVRELRNHIERSVRPVEGTAVLDLSMPLKEARAKWVQMFERQYIGELLNAHGGNVTAAARSAGVDRVHFYRLLARTGLK